jgi:hypothetical protein
MQISATPRKKSSRKSRAGEAVGEDPAVLIILAWERLAKSSAIFAGAVSAAGAREGLA